LDTSQKGQNYLERFEVCCGKDGKRSISWTDRVKNEEALRRAKEERNVLPAIKGRKDY